MGLSERLFWVEYKCAVGKVCELKRIEEARLHTFVCQRKVLHFHTHLWLTGKMESPNQSGERCPNWSEIRSFAKLSHIGKEIALKYYQQHIFIWMPASVQKSNSRLRLKEREPCIIYWRLFFGHWSEHLVWLQDFFYTAIIGLLFFFASCAFAAMNGGTGLERAAMVSECVHGGYVKDNPRPDVMLPVKNAPGKCFFFLNRMGWLIVL